MQKAFSILHSALQISSRFDPLREHEPFAFREHARGLESFGLKRGGCVEPRTALRAREERAEAAAWCGADHDRAATGTQDAERLAQRRDAIVRAHRADEAAGIVDYREIERPALGAQARQRRDLDIDEHTRLRGAFARTRG